LGLSGLCAAAIGLVLIGPSGVRQWVDDLRSGTVTRPSGEMLAVLVGVGLAALSVLVELAAALRTIVGRRGAFGSNVAVQILLALALLVGINWFSFNHYRRFDWTHDRRFTLSEDIRKQMSELRGETTIVVYQRHKTLGHMTDKPDVYDFAAERQVVEKIRDLVDQFRELGPQFRVEVLDVEEEGYADKLARIGERSPELRQAVDRATENSIFFYADGKVQRLGFGDVFALDKKASQEANDGRGNLVLLDQGVGPFARRILNVDEKRPRIAVGVIHELLSTEGASDAGTDIGMRGVKKTLEAHGLDTRDLILKKWSEFAGPEPATLTYDESKYERLEEQLAEIEAAIKILEQEKSELQRLVGLWKDGTLEDLNKEFAAQLRGQKLTDADRGPNLARMQQMLTIRELLADQQREEREALVKEKTGLNVERLAEQRRIADLKAKTERMLADCDLLIVPRLTLLNAARGDLIPHRVYRLDDAQVDAVKSFLKAGKPVLGLLGPPFNEPQRAMMDPLGGGPDKLETMFEDLGFKLPRQTVLFNVESKSFAERRGGLLIMGTTVEVPPARFDGEAGAARPGLAPQSPADSSPNPIRESMRVTTQSGSRDQELDLRLRHPRPIYFEPATPPSFDPVFMMTAKESWNEDQPFATRERTPRYEPPKKDDPGAGTVEEKRLGPFPIAACAEVTLPAVWYEQADATPATARVGVIGHGGVFLGNTLSPVREKLLLDTCNWLLGRDDLLTKDDRRWQYPRVNLSEREQELWQWGTRLGLPLAFAYLGLIVLLVRRLR
jgi:hypothetical protein